VSRVRIEGLSKRFAGRPPTIAIDDLDLEIETGEFLVLLGPSGCGKTTTLRCLAGLETADRGSIAFGERRVFDAARRVDVAPNKRNIGMVFQSYALWPHMTVRKNVAYPLRAKKVRGKQANEWVEEVSQLVDTVGLLDRYPAQLSGGQQQRVALSRGLVARPELVLFDEPLSNLDARLRELVRTEIYELHKRMQFTAVYVTHDQTEALALGDRLAIMRSGALEQLGRPDEIFEEPATEYVADFIGMSNRLVFERIEQGWTYEGEPLDGDLSWVPTTSPTLTVRARSEDVRLGAPGTAPEWRESVTLPATVVASEFGGRHLDVVVTIGATRVQSRIPAGERGGWARSLESGQQVAASLRVRDLAFYDEAGRLVSSAGHRVAVAS
jgi:iron(III) transport system ATP-binding protein